MIAALLPLLGACEEKVRVREPGIGAVVEEHGSIVVRERPLVLREEVIPASPGERFVWRPGHWTWRNGWTWVPGRYVERPHPEAAWVPGHWAERRWGWAWVPGHWMQARRAAGALPGNPVCADLSRMTPLLRSTCSSTGRSSIGRPAEGTVTGSRNGERPLRGPARAFPNPRRMVLPSVLAARWSALARPPARAVLASARPGAGSQ